MVKQNNIYRIRKLTIGVASALIASAFILSSTLISADEVTTTQENATTMTEVVPTHQAESATTSATTTEEATTLEHLFENGVTREDEGDVNEIIKNARFTNDPANFNGTVTFVTNHGNVDVKFTNGTESLNHTDIDGNSANTGDSGHGTSKAYFIGFSNVPNFRNNPGEKLVYSYEAIQNLFPEGLKGGEKVYAKYLTATEAMYYSGKMTGKITVNKEKTAAEMSYNEATVKKEVENNEATYYADDAIREINNLNIGAVFEMDPFTTAVLRYSPNHYFQPGTAEYYPTTNPDEYNDPTNKNYTYVDLHVKLDSRIKLAKVLDFTFSSYTFQPHMILDKNNQKIAATFETNNTSPDSRITFDTTSLNGGTEFTIRTRIRRLENMQENVDLATASQPMKLTSNKKDNFTIDRNTVFSIAKGEEDAITAGGSIDGSAKLYSMSIFGFKLGGISAIPKTTSPIVTYNYAFNKVTFDRNSSAFENGVEQTVGTVNVVHNKSISSDELNTNTQPDMNTIGDSMPVTPSNVIVNGKEYKFKEWNTQADGQGQAFSDSTVVSEDMTVYGIWEEVVYHVTYRFESTTAGKLLPQAINDLLPTDNAQYNNNEQVTPIAPAKSVVDNENGQWKFLGYVPTSATIQGADVEFVGQWAYEEKVAPTPAPTPTPDPKPTPETEKKPSTVEESKKEELPNTGTTASLAVIGFLALIGAVLVLTVKNKKA